MILRILLALALLGIGSVTAAAGETVRMNERGLHVQDWFHRSELNLAADLQAASAQGKDLMVLVEQRGCTYCAKLHATNFSRDEIVGLLGESFLVVQLDLNGSRVAAGFDGLEMSEASLLQKWGIALTPTTMVFAGGNAGAVTAAEAETFRLPGYLEPLQYYLALDYFASGSFETLGFGEFLNARVAEMTEAGIEPQNW